MRVQLFKLFNSCPLYSLNLLLRSDEQNDFTENIENDTLATDSHKNVDSSIKSQVLFIF